MPLECRLWRVNVSLLGCVAGAAWLAEQIEIGTGSVEGTGKSKAPDDLLRFRAPDLLALNPESLVLSSKKYDISGKELLSLCDR